ncbi:MAG: WYL domain-containing protein [Firmicutes bacterium]|nr:WYL domain-containing protein [Bacillota bacterium]
MSKISNAITMMELLQSGRKYSIKELSKTLEVSERMVRVYKEELEKAGIYIDTIMGPYGGYVLNQTVRVPVRKFKMTDSKLLDKYIKEESDPQTKEKLIMLQDKIKGVYIGSIQESEELNLKDETLKKYNMLTRAIKERRKVKILYYSYGKGENERVIDPAEMFLFQDGWYVAAFCERKKDIRHFELKRIINYELLEEKYM